MMLSSDAYVFLKCGLVESFATALSSACAATRAAASFVIDSECFMARLVVHSQIVVGRWLIVRSSVVLVGPIPRTTEEGAEQEDHSFFACGAGQVHRWDQ